MAMRNRWSQRSFSTFSFFFWICSLSFGSTSPTKTLPNWNESVWRLYSSTRLSLPNTRETNVRLWSIRVWNVSHRSVSLSAVTCWLFYRSSRSRSWTSPSILIFICLSSTSPFFLGVNQWRFFFSPKWNIDRREVLHSRLRIIAFKNASADAWVPTETANSMFN